jgi:glycoprotein endo-alpha-1,2-mannosidase
MKNLFLILVIVLLAACAPAAPTTQPATVQVSTVTPIPPTEIPLPPVTGPDPSYKVAAFYYPWYGNPQFDGEWIHWTQAGNTPPRNISSDYYPELGAYSSNDPAVVAQHMAWLRQAGVGVIIVSWWGQGSIGEHPVPLILQMANRYGIKVAFHIEPYSGRTANGLVNDIKYLYNKYGSDPAFFRTTSSSLYSMGNQPKGMFFVWSIGYTESDGQQVQADYWQNAMDEIHALPDSALVIANTLQTSWINGGHFDGLYNYITLHVDQDGGFGWSQGLPPGALYVPSVMPGNSARRVGYPESTYVDRADGQTYNEQWTAALGTGVQPELVTITSFNEWHEGSMIEPPAIGVENGSGYTYSDFGALPPDGYLSLTHDWIDTYLATAWPATYRARIKVTTTSDWTTLNVVSGGAWMQPVLVSASETVTSAGMESGGRFVLTQSLEDAGAGKKVEMVWDVLLTGLADGQDLILQIDRGNYGFTEVTIYNFLGESPVELKTFKWNGITTDRNSFEIKIPANNLINPSP